MHSDRLQVRCSCENVGRLPLLPDTTRTFCHGTWPHFSQPEPDFANFALRSFTPAASPITQQRFVWLFLSRWPVRVYPGQDVNDCILGPGVSTVVDDICRKRCLKARHWRLKVLWALQPSDKVGASRCLSGWQEVRGTVICKCLMSH